VLFAVVALVTGFIGDRLRRAGIALGAVHKELRQLRLDTGDILASINTGVLSVDGAGRLAYLNPAGETLLGLDARQWQGAPVVTTVDEIAPGMGKMIQNSIDEGKPTTRFRTVAKRNGREVVLGVSTTVLGRGEGELRSATALFQDISDLERVEALNRRAEKLEAVAELSASLAHEIKNPLASIRSAVEQIAKPALAQEDRTLLQRLVVAESDRLSRLLSEFLEFSGLRMGKQEVVDLRDVARDCVALARQHSECPEKVEVDLHVPETPLLVHGDRDLLHRAVFNLILNAAHFSGPEGKVTVDVRSTTRRGVQRKEGVRLSVGDTGPGVSAEDLPRIFDPFYTRRAGGSGLGLAVVHRAVVAHEGTVSVDRAPGGGAEFTVELPAATTASSSRRKG
jgi:PAS domain S-box-containing protein